MWKLYLGIAGVSAIVALFIQKKDSWTPKTKQKYLELKDTDNFEYSYTPKNITEKQKKEPTPGPKSKFDSLFEYGRRKNPYIDPEKQQKLIDEIEKIKEEERENLKRRQDNRIGEVENDYMRRPIAASTTDTQKTPSYYSSNTNTLGSYARPDTQNAFTNNTQTNNFTTSAINPKPLNDFGASRSSTGSSFLGSIMDSAMQSTNRQQQTENPPQTGWQSTQPRKENIKKTLDEKKDNGDKDWIPMDLFGN